MAIENLPVWPFEPNWSESVSEVLSWLTDVMSSKIGAEQRRALRPNPKRSFEFATMAEGPEQALLSNLLSAFSAQKWYLPIWYDVSILDTGVPSGSTFLPCRDAASSGMRAGAVAFIAGNDAFTNELVEIQSIGANGITLVGPTTLNWPAGARIFPVTIGRLTDQPQLRKRSSSLVTSNVRFDDLNPTPVTGTAPKTAGPLIANGLIANAYHQETGRGGYFHHNSGTSEGQFIFIYGLYMAYEQMMNGTPTQKAAGAYYRNLAEEMLDAMGDGSEIGPMLRQAVPSNANTITLMHWLFAAKGDIPGQELIFALERPVHSTGTVRIPVSAGGATVFKVWAIYPSTSTLLYDSPFSPAFDTANPTTNTRLDIADGDWRIDSSGVTIINLPAGAPTNINWKIVYGYSTEGMIPAGQAFEAYPNWTRIEPGYAACAPDTFRWFEQAMTKAMVHDKRPGKYDKWNMLRAAMRRTAPKGQNITDLREVIEPLPGFDAIPVRGAPDGMYCYTDHPAALGPSNGGNMGWKGYDWWRRNSAGRIIGTIPANNGNLVKAEIGRGFRDQWRIATSYQDADQYLYVRISDWVVPNAAEGEHLRVYVSSTQAYDPDTRWYAEIGTLPRFESSVETIEFYIPRTSFRKVVSGSGADTVWGSVLPGGTWLENFGIEAAYRRAHTVRLDNIRLVASANAAGVAGSQMPYFPGAMPFAINADLNRQRFVGWNGSPFHGYQLADFWWWLATAADLAHPTLKASDLPIPDQTTGALTFPITATVGGLTKPKNALLMEQQLMFLRHAQLKYNADGGPNGFFAHTFVLNTPARESLGNPRPHSWTYTNDDPNTRWVGYQTRIVESLAELLLLTKDAPAFEDSRTLARTMINAWLGRLNVIWPNLNGVSVGGKLVRGMPTDFPDPRVSAPQTLYDEPHAAAHILRACVTMKAAGETNTSLLNTLMKRCWDYLELMWVTTGEMKFTWSPDPANKQWYGFWHGDILTTLATMLAHPTQLASGIDTEVVMQRLVETQQWLRDIGVGVTQPNTSAGLTHVYRDFHVLTLPTDDTENLNVDYERMIEDVDNEIAVPYRVDTAGRAFRLSGYSWVLEGRSDHTRFSNFLRVLRGRAKAIWLPTFMDDFELAADGVAGSDQLICSPCGYTLSGGPRRGRQDIMVETTTGVFFARILSSTVNQQGREVLTLDTPLPFAVPQLQLIRISVLNLVRLNHDDVQIDHRTDTAGVSTVKLTFRDAPDLRKPEAAFYE